MGDGAARLDGGRPTCPRSAEIGCTIGQAVLFAVIASSALPLGGWIGAWHRPSRRVTAALLAFASGALITAVAFELFEDAFEHGGAARAGAAFLAGATVFIVADTWLDRRIKGRHASGARLGFALLAAVTLDGVPENLAMGVSLVESGSATLLVAIFASNLPEAIVGSDHRDGPHTPPSGDPSWRGMAS